MKDYSGTHRHHVPSKIAVGDTVLLKQPQKSKLSTPFNPEPVRVVARNGSIPVLRKQNGVELARNVSHVKQVPQEAAKKWPHDTHEDSDYDGDDTLTTQPLRNRRLVWQR